MEKGKTQILTSFMDKNRSSPPFLPLYDYQFPSVPDDEFKRFHTIDRKLYGKLINILGRDATESMKVMAFFLWIEDVTKDRSFVAKLYDFTPPLLNKVVDEALQCVKCTEDDIFNGYDSPDIFLIPNILKNNFTLKYFHENRPSAFRGITNSLKTVCFRAFDDIHAVKQPNYSTRESSDPTTNVINTDFTRASLVPTTNAMNTDFTRVSLVPTTNAMNTDLFRTSLVPTTNAKNIDLFRASFVPTTNAMNTDVTRASFVPTPNVMNIDHEIRTVLTINNPSPYAPIGGGDGSGGVFLESMIPRENKIEELGTLNNSRMMPLVKPNHFLGGASNIEELGRADTRMVPMNPSHVQGVGALNVEEFARASNRMVPMNPNLVPGVGAPNIDELARATARMVPMNPSHVPGMGMVGEMHLHLPYVIPNQMVQYIPPYHGGSAMNLLPPPPIPYNAHNFAHASSSGSGVFLSQMLPGPYNYHHDIGGAQTTQAMNMDFAEMLNNLNILDVVKEENDTAPDDRTVFLTFSKGYPISEAEVKDFFTRKFGEDVEAVYMQEVPQEEQALYARLVTRSPALLEAIVDGGKAKYNINGKHVWARKYVKKQNPKIMFVGQSSSSAPPTPH